MKPKTEQIMDKKKTTNESRRAFLKKAAYTVPTVIALGQITNPVTSSAASFVGGQGSETDNSNNPSTGGSDRSDAYNIFGN
jgi:hypothetical protein